MKWTEERFPSSCSRQKSKNILVFLFVGMRRVSLFVIISVCKAQHLLAPLCNVWLLQNSQSNYIISRLEWLRENHLCNAFYSTPLPIVSSPIFEHKDEALTMCDILEFSTFAICIKSLLFRTRVRSHARTFRCVSWELLNRENKKKK